MNKFSKQNDSQTHLNLTQTDFGAQVLGAKAGALTDVFFLSDLEMRGEGKPYRGGVPVLFPQFNRFGDYRKHGYLRDMDWQIKQVDSDDKLITQADIHLAPIENWQHDCDVRLTTTVTDKKIVMTLTVINTGDDFEFTSGLHPYFAINSAMDKLDIQGLSGVHAVNYSENDSSFAKGEFVFDGTRIERLFDSAPAVTFDNGQDTLKISCTGFDQWMVWNCGADDAIKMADLPDEDWNKFICIEPVIVDNPVKLPAGQSFVASMTVEVV